MPAAISPDDRHDDYIGFECQRVTLVSNTDTTITFAEGVRAVKVINFDAGNVILVKNGSISGSSDTTAARVGFAPATNVPNGSWFPFRTTSIHILSAGASSVDVLGYF